MPRNYTKVVGPTQRFRYTEESFNDAVKSVEKGSSICKAAEVYGVPKSTLADYLQRCKNGEEILKPGGQPVFNASEENNLVKGLLLCASWGFPMHSSDIRDVVKTVLDKEGRNVKAFSDNLPGEDWVWCFLQRHPELTQRLAENIKRSRAAVGEKTINDYFDSLQVSLKDVPPENLLNYDETNFTDDPGNKKFVVRRGCKHPERIIDHSKTATSVMFCVAGDGTLLPVFIVYKALYIYPTWVEQGLPDWRYSSTKSGWFDMRTFEEWFTTVALPFLKTKPGKKALIGDNLGSHLSVSVLKLCEENNISFILLPPNSTHLTQPLDVSVFRPVKAAWRRCLTDWKRTHRGVVPKSEFPSLLKATINSLGNNLLKNIKSGFKACGLIPLNKEEVLKKIPREKTEETSGANWAHSLQQKLSQCRAPEEQPNSSKGRGKRISVTPGTSVSAEQIQPGNTSSTATANAATVMNRDANNEDQFTSDASDLEEQSEGEEIEDNPEPVLAAVFKEKDFVLVKYITEQDNRSKFYVGQAVNIFEHKDVEIKFLRKQMGKKEIFFTFPNVPDVETVLLEAIVCKLDVTDLRRGRFAFKKLHEKVDLNEVY